MTEIRVKFDLTFSRRFITAAGAAAMMLCAVPELDSESVTLSTYYPAPSGVYTNMITTGNTVLARDGGRYINAANGSAVALGVVTPEVNSKLTVSNGGISGTYGITPRYVGWNAYGTGDGGAAIYNDAGAYQGLMLVGNNSGGGVRRVKVWDEMTVNGRLIGTAAADISGAIQTRQGTACSDGSHWYPPAPPGLPGGGIAALCPGQYVTLTDGIYAKKTVLAIVPGAAAAGYTIDYRCCPCPPSGCGGM